VRRDRRRARVHRVGASGSERAMAANDDCATPDPGIKHRRGCLGRALAGGKSQLPDRSYRIRAPRFVGSSSTARSTPNRGARQLPSVALRARARRTLDPRSRARSDGEGWQHVSIIAPHWNHGLIGVADPILNTPWPSGATARNRRPRQQRRLCPSVSAKTCDRTIFTGCAIALDHLE